MSIKQFVKMLFLAAMVSLMVLTIFSCGGRDETGPNVSGSTASGTVQKVLKVDCATATIAEIVSMQNNTTINPIKEVFIPDMVTIKQNEIVKWTNNDTNPWWVRSGENPGDVPEGGSFGSPSIPVNESYCLKFTAPGTYNYHCADTVKGVVIVQ